MADVEIVTNLTWPSGNRTAKPIVVWVNVDVAYVFYASEDEGLYYTKTTDGGATWAVGILIIDGGGSLDDIFQIAVWYDRWTPGIVGTLIHCSIAHKLGTTTTFYSYCQVDTTDDSVSDEIAVFSHGAVLGERKIGITKSKDGTLYILGGVSSTHTVFHKSVDGGATWGVALADPFNLHTSAAFMMFPATWADDDADIAFVWITSVTDKWQLTTYDASADSVSDTDIYTNQVDAAGEFAQGPAMAIRHSDEHIIVALVDYLGSSTADLRLFDISGSASITELTQVVSNTNRLTAPAVLISPQNDDIYVAYIIPITNPTDMPVFYKLSTDGGTSWGTQIAYSADSADYIITDSPVSLQDGGMFAPILVERSAPLARFINVDNAVKIAGQEKDHDTPPGDTDTGDGGGGKPGDGSTSNPKGEGVGLLQPAMILGSPPSSTVGLSGFEQLTHNLLVTDGFQGDLDDLAEHNEVAIKSG